MIQMDHTFISLKIVRKPGGLTKWRICPEYFKSMWMRDYEITGIIGSLVSKKSKGGAAWGMQQKERKQVSSL